MMLYIKLIVFAALFVAAAQEPSKVPDAHERERRESAKAGSQLTGKAAYDAFTA